MKRYLFLPLVALVLLGIGCSGTDVSERSGTPTTNSGMLIGESDVAVKTEDVVYTTSGIKGFFAMPETEGTYPGVIMIHEWWGLNDNIKAMAKELAKDGYMVLAVDLYNGRVATTSSEAQKLRSSLKQEDALSNMRQAVQHLRAKGATKMASLGWCFGGGQSLQLALSEEPLDATVIYYGNLVTSTQALAKIKAPILGIFGDKDMSIPVQHVHDFDKALDTVGVENRIHIYPGVGHAFANPSGQNYAPEATKDAWTKTTAFLREHLQ
ncbi:MAG TPA: dienelactone hydrolase family protein [Candidatus Kapabacteria bacterium]|nr:dienelactone hydrolase family protein [Candidatus Kapabacteria bacterium]